MNASALIPLYLPHLGAALVLASIVLTLGRRWTDRSDILSSLFAITLLISLVPLAEFSLTHYARVLTGDMSVAGMVWLTAINVTALRSPGVKAHASVHLQIAATLLLIALFLYPTALGFSPFDLYAYGYSPVALPVVLVCLFGVCVWFEKWLPAVMLLTAYGAWYFRCLDTDNLWDYLLDPVIVIYSVSILVIKCRRQRLQSVAESA